MTWLDVTDIQFAVGDILKCNVDSIVCPVSVTMEEYGKISRQLLNIANPSLNADINQIKKGLPSHKLTLGQAVSLDCSPAYHIRRFKTLIFVALWDHQSEYTQNLFYKAYGNCIRTALKNDLQSIALPVMAYDGKLEFCTWAILNVLRDFNKLKNSSEFSIQEMLFVSKNERHIEYIQEMIEPRLYRINI